MDGDMAPLPTILDIVDQYVARDRQCIVLDEAHSTGVYGQQGRGVGHALGEEGGWGEGSHKRGKGRITVRLMTFGKAVGASGGELNRLLHVINTHPSGLVVYAHDKIILDQLCSPSNLLDVFTTHHAFISRSNMGRA